MIISIVMTITITITTVAVLSLMIATSGTDDIGSDSVCEGCVVSVCRHCTSVKIEGIITSQESSTLNRIRCITIAAPSAIHCSSSEMSSELFLLVVPRRDAR